MTAMNRAAHVAAELSRDTGYISTTVHIDPTKWSSRRRNIIVGALNSGLASCGSDTAYFIDALTQAYGARVQSMSKWNKSFTTQCIKEEEVDNLVAYTCVWIRLKFSREHHVYDVYNYQNRNLERFLDIVERGGIPESIPAPEIKSSEQGPFIKKYLKSDAETIQLRQNLAQKIAQGETLTITVKAR
mgnify:CR=1 FL=1|tara:strand:+ start:977 stop:1537 length:561 start_codon:yes stop_codon:yes gene_type:complete